MLIVLLNLLLNFTISIDPYPTYRQTIILANDLYEAIGISGNGRIIAKITSLDHSNQKFILKVQQISNQMIVDVFQMEMPIIPIGHFMWKISLSQNGGRIAVHSYYTYNILIFQRTNQSQILQYIHVDQKMLQSNFGIQSFAMSQDGSVIILGNYTDFVEVYVHNQSQFQLRQTIKISIQQQKLKPQYRRAQITAKNSIIILNQAQVAEQQMGFSYIFIYRNSLNTQNPYVLAQKIIIRCLPLQILGFSYNQQLLAFTVGQSLIQIYAKSNESKFVEIQSIAKCQKIKTGRFKFINNGKRILLFCQRHQSTMAFIVAYNLKNQTGSLYYQQKDSISDIKLKNSLFSNDGRYILIANQKGPCQVYLLYGQCEIGFSISPDGQCRKCQENEDCFQSSFQITTICLVFISFIAVLIVVSILVRRFCRIYMIKNKQGANQTKYEEFTVQMVGKSEESIQHIKQNITVSKLQAARCQFCKKQAVTHISSCLHFYHFQCVNQIQQQGSNQCANCHKHLSYNNVFQIKKEQLGNVGQ